MFSCCQRGKMENEHYSPLAGFRPSAHSAIPHDWLQVCVSDQFERDTIMVLWAWDLPDLGCTLGVMQNWSS